MVKGWKRERRGRDRNTAERRLETVEICRDASTGLILRKWGADHGPAERSQRAGGIQISRDKIFALLGPAYATMPGPVEILAGSGVLGEGAAMRRRIEASQTLRQTATIAGVQRRMSGRYDVGQPGRDASAEESPRVTRARAAVTRIAEKLGWPVLGVLLELTLFELEIPPCPVLPPPPEEKEIHPLAGESPAAFRERRKEHRRATWEARRAWEAECEPLEARIAQQRAQWMVRFARVPFLLDGLADALHLALGED